MEDLFFLCINVQCDSLAQILLSSIPYPFLRLFHVNSSSKTARPIGHSSSTIHSPCSDYLSVIAGYIQTTKTKSNRNRLHSQLINNHLFNPDAIFVLLPIYEGFLFAYFGALLIAKSLPYA